ncbi:TPA: hypothetical protein ACLEX3_002404 [Pseudomonas aeruginosa]
MNKLATTVISLGTALLLGCGATKEDFHGVYESPALPNGNYVTMVVKEDRVVLMTYSGIMKKAINPIILETKVEDGRLVLRDKTSEVIYERGKGHELVCLKCPNGVPTSFKLVAESVEEWEKG